MVSGDTSILDYPVEVIVKGYYEEDLDNENYIIFEKQLVQLGHPKVSRFFDNLNILHIVLIDARTAQYNSYDFIYDNKNECFAKNKLTENLSINYYG